MRFTQNKSDRRIRRMTHTETLQNEPSFSEWVGRRQQTDDVVGLNATRRLAALLDKPSAAKVGDRIPGYWYQILFSPCELQSALAADGHPAKGDFLPPIPLPRRMFAGRQVRFVNDLHVGDAVTRTSAIHRIVPKNGRSGAMCFVTVRHEIRNVAGLVLIEEDQDIVYRGPAGDSPAVAAAAAPEPPMAEFEACYQPDATLLFRYSAITFNAHRIHYDLPYARDVEGYPGLVVNGGLTTMKLWDAVADRTGRAIAASRSRNLKPLFADRTVTLRMAHTGPDRVLAWALDADGALAMRVEIDLGAAS
ncbi:MaoC family dehydratase N-terminal domain-containing protein [Hydrogenophaga sp. 2FB]|uniref:FAS1-like dehydratase domain-containing protein n=1 Tax=Hydrogenophaga sp. 2FB TaxID=2502187 RepID=UPI0010F6986C|nr:MaoC family dehydratase N-terminal domain-containing protein [Hydrogenophaga sp. 2FB]